ncbi:MAG TPA: diaminopimelate decarboxylase [Vicinamibacteria bacterium]|nr:diaminopimelate decarboxylase [Vicinamibacteria bacterium]
MTGFERREGVLLCDGVSLEEAAARFGTPLYVYSAAAVASAYTAYDRAFAAVPHRVCYALKANGSGALLRLLAGLGAGADIVSGFELEAALRAGFPPGRIIFSGVGKTDGELAQGLAAGIAEFNAESEDEIRRLSRAAEAAGRPARVTLRVNPDIDPRSHPYISTGLRENKFGVDIAEAPAILSRAARLPGLTVTGVQCHIGSQITDLDPLAEAARELAALSRRLLADGLPLQTIDVGGGLGVDYEGGTPPDPRALAARILPVLEGLPLTLLVEPGRSLVAAAGVLLTRVLDLKENRGKLFVIVDAGMNDLLRPALYQAFHRVEPVVARRRPTRRVDVVGPVCETGDFLARDRNLELPEPGELYVVRDAGAYGFCMSSNYNMRPRAAEVLVDDGTLRLIRRRETFDDLIATEVG